MPQESSPPASHDATQTHRLPTEWSAPVERWVRRATDRDGKILGAPARLLLDDYWSKADAPSKRDPGPAFVHGKWVEFAEIARDFQCDERTIRTQFGQLKRAGLAKRGLGINDKGREVDGVWLADQPVTGRFDPDHLIRPAGQDDPPKRIKRSEAIDQMIQDSGSFDQSNRIKPSKNPDQMIRLYKEDPINPTDPTTPNSGRGAPEQFSLIPLEADADGARPATASEIRAWWAEVYLPIRAEVFGRWRPDSKIRPIQCSPRIIAQIRKLLADTCDGDSEFQLGGLTHVVRCAAAKVDAQRGAVVPWPSTTDRSRTYDTIKNIAPVHWLGAEKFAALLAEDIPSPNAGKTAATGVVRRAMPEYSRGGDFQ